ncbi:hypothetical protein EI981_07925 [Paenibacillus lutimineralis]|uniref:Uncharacterized protein n=1 Tax=Paenibacillus lutimineralis TaxID=2707005 RepID=A0A3S9UVK3_9BACL|nr:hypothetical protein [Paenibacillus lutimineralis]AZS14388.1 hypothetical protein EI981_07925 [Paenibacillus lutimineralis]
MDTRNNECKGCQEEYKVTEESIQRLLASPLFTSDQCVDDEVYNERLRICNGCAKLQNGINCTICGCIIPVAAKLKRKSCTLPGGALW